MRKKLAVVVAVILAMTMVLAGCGGEKSGDSGDSGDKKKFIIGHSMAEDTSFGHTMKILESDLEDTGYFDVEVHGASSLGSEPECIQATQHGDIQLYMTIAGTYSAFIPAIYVFDYQMPWIGNGDEGIEVLEAIYSDKEFSEFIKKESEGTGLKVVGFSTLGYRTFTTNKEIVDFEDWKGLDLRTIENPIHIEAINSWGATATPLSFTEVYAGLQQGLINGQSNPPEPTYSSKLYEPQDYITNANHVFHVVLWTVSEDSWNSYSKEEQEAVQEAIDKATVVMSEYCLENTDKYLEIFEEDGCQPIYLPYETLKQMQDSVQPANAKIPEYSGEEAYDLFVKTFEKCTKDLGYDQSKESYDKYVESKTK